MKIIVAPEAREHLLELKAWWDENRPAARVRVEDAYALALEQLREQPWRGKRYTGRPDYRVLRLKGTPYSLYYRIDEDADELTIVAAWSGVRGDEPPLP